MLLFEQIIDYLEENRLYFAQHVGAQTTGIFTSHN